MMKFPYTDTNKRYHTFIYHCTRTFGGRLARVPLDAGFTCPNKDGTCGFGGCSYCASGSMSASSVGTLAEQYAAGLAVAERKWGAKIAGTIPYLQANTNTYAPPEKLAALYEQCARFPRAAFLAIGTRADCLSPDVVEVLARTAEKIPVLVELGLQTVHESTLTAIGRGYGHREFLAGYARLDEVRRRTGRLSIGLHILNGLPGETEGQMLETAKAAARLRPDHVKLHTLCVLRGTRLEADYAAGRYTPLDRETAVRIVCRQLAVLPPETVIDRVCADAPDDILLAPAWVRQKTVFQNEVDKFMAQNDLWQGDAWQA